MTARTIDGKAIAAAFREHTSSQVTEFIDRTGITPHLAAVLVGDDSASAVYVRNKQRACSQTGIRSTLHRLPGDTTEERLLQLIAELNNDATVHGILVQLPVPEQIVEQRVLDSVSTLKDVDSFHPENVGLIVQGRPRFLPCTLEISVRFRKPRTF